MVIMDNYPPMKSALWVTMGLCLSLNVSGLAQQLTQTFEPGEDTSNWGSSGFTNGQIVAGFLDPGFGGLNAGGNASTTQSFSRSFRNNTIGLDVKSAYSISLYIQVDSFDGAAGGDFQIVDGAFGTGNAVDLRILTEQVSPGNFVYHWQARDNSTGWVDMGIDLTLGDPFHIVLNVNPATNTYSATVESVDRSGNLLDWSTLTDLAFDPNVINNGQNGTLLFNIVSSAGGDTVRIDNIGILGTPEPSRAMTMMGGILVLSWLRRRKPL